MKCLPSTTFSEIVDMTEAQRVKVEELTKLGWIKVSEPEGTFNGALLIEGLDGLTYFLDVGGGLNVSC